MSLRSSVLEFHRAVLGCSLIGALAIASLLVISGCDRPAEVDQSAAESTAEDAAGSDSLRFPNEAHLRNIRQLTFGGNNAEAYWSSDGEQLIFQSDWAEINGQGCDQIFVMNADGSPLGDEQYRLVSTGEGRTTCSYFLPGDRIVYASTHEGARECPPPVVFQRGRYVWPIYADYDIYSAARDGSDLQLLIGGPGYDAEATVSPDGKYVVFTSTRSGDLDLWRYEIETGALLQLTDELGYDGGAFFSRDSQKIVWRADRPTGEAAATYQALLAENVVEPSALNIFVADIDGSNVKQVTDLEGANWAPFFHPDGQRIIFTTNHHMMDTNPREFDLFLINVDGTGLERVTFSGTFDGFPMFSLDGEKLSFSSNRYQANEGETNVFVADWVD